MIGIKSGKLTVVSFLHKDERNRKYWSCQCECGNTTKAQQSDLLKQRIKSCGCYRLKWITLHDYSKKPHSEYTTWEGMKQRCNNPKATGYENYGGRNIHVCSRWENSFLDFLADMGPRPSEKHSLDRINSNGNYEPGNVRWVTKDVQIENQRHSNQFIKYGKSKRLGKTLLKPRTSRISNKRKTSLRGMGKVSKRITN